MATVTVVLGLAGSGKTDLLNRMTGMKIFDEGVYPENPDGWDPFLDALASGKDCAIVEIRYLNKFGRRQLKERIRQLYPDTKFEWVCFENDLESANWNCSNDPTRDIAKVTGDLANNSQWTCQYEIPKRAIVRKIFRLPPLKK